MVRNVKRARVKQSFLFYAARLSLEDRGFHPHLAIGLVLVEVYLKQIYLFCKGI
jgi:hypothetical protein